LRAEIDGKISLGFRAHDCAIFRPLTAAYLGNSLLLSAGGGL
jgi:hypothetical protein